MKTTKHADRQKLFPIKHNQPLKLLLAQINKALTSLVPLTTPITELNAIIYASALLCQNKLQQYPPRNANPKPKVPTSPRWKKDLLNKIDKARAETSQIHQYLQNPVRPGKLGRRIHKIKQKYNLYSHIQLQRKKIELQASIPALANNIKEKERKQNNRTHNQQFNTNPRKFYRQTIQEQIKVTNPPTAIELNQFWRPLYENPVQHNQNPEWMQTLKEKLKPLKRMTELKIDTTHIKQKLSSSSNFKAAGPDRIPNFWLKHLTALHPHLAAALNRIIKTDEPTPAWLTTGTTTLIPKSEETHLPNKYRPICCLNTTYKLLTGLIADHLYEHLDQQKCLEEEQKGCKRGSHGTKDQLLLNKAILEDSRRRGRNLCMAWVDYQKAYDSVPHSWIVRCLQLYKIHPSIIATIELQMAQWKTTINLHHERGTITIDNIQIQRGIFQGDSLSPLLFCLAIDPLSKILNSSPKGYNMSDGRRKDPAKTINHLLYMDDLKLYTSSEEDLKQLINSVQQFSQDIGMSFGIDKCAKCTIKKGSKVEAVGIGLESGQELRELEGGETYKYLGVEESEVIEHRKMREKVRAEYEWRVKRICRTELTPKNKIVSINQLAVPVLTYSFGVIDWPQSVINAIDVKTIEKYSPCTKSSIGTSAYHGSSYLVNKGAWD